ncbi:MAG: tetratricopeptide repeat protein [Pseudomonadota bacterium]|nr:tetratricopeptide repeat protein [Pseudomonadota bacterium]
MSDLIPVDAYGVYALGAAATVYGSLKFIGTHLASDARAYLSLWLQGDYNSTWSTQFCQWFDLVFGKKHLSWSCFLRSSLASVLFVLAIYFLFGPVLGLLTQRSGSTYTVGEVLLLGMVLNLIPDYLSLLETRWLLQRFERVRGFWPTLILLVVDVVITGAIIGLAIILYKWVRAPDLGIGHTLGLFDITAIFFYSSFFTSLFSWLYCISTWFVKLFCRTGMSKLLDVNDNPQNSLALVSAVLILISSFGFQFFFPGKEVTDASSSNSNRAGVMDRMLCDLFPDTCADVARLTDDELEKLSLFIKGCRGGDIALCGEVSAKKFSVQDYELAAELWGKACDGGDSSGCTNLGLLYSHGQGVDKNLHRSAQLYSLGCDGGDPSACNNLAGLYSRGDGVVLALNKAIELYQQACDMGSALGCTNLGILYGSLGMINGSGPEMKDDPLRAAQWVLKGCEEGDARGCTILGSWYKRGYGVEVNLTRAAELWGRACDAGDARGCRLLESM